MKLSLGINPINLGQTDYSTLYLLPAREQSLCISLKIGAERFVEIKDVLMSYQIEHGPFKKRVAQQVHRCLFSCFEWMSTRSPKYTTTLSGQEFLTNANSKCWSGECSVLP